MTREIFFSTFDSICLRNGDKPALISVEGNNARYLSYSSLSSTILQLYEAIFEQLCPLKSVNYVGLMISKKYYLIPLMISIWKAGHAVGLAICKPFVHCRDNLIKCSYLCSDVLINDIVDFKLIRSFEIDETNIYLYKNINSQVLTLPNCVNWDMCYMLSSSGSTGAPKIIQVPWSCIYPNVLDICGIFELTTSDILLSLSPCSFDPFFVDFFCSVISGAALLLVNLSDSFDGYFHGKKFTNQYSNPHQIKENSNNALNKKYSLNWLPLNTPLTITCIQTTPSIFKSLFNAKTVLNEHSSLKILALGGEPFPIFNVPKTNCRIFNLYGITEISCWAFVHEVLLLNKYRMPLGKPLKDIFYRFEKNGELLIGSNRKCLVGQEDCSKMQVTVYRNTGDIIDFNEVTGNLYFNTRSSNIIKKFGIKINLLKMESLMSGVENVTDFFVVFEEIMGIVGWFLRFKSSEITSSHERLRIDKRRAIEEAVVNKLKDIEKPDCIIELKELPLNYHGKIDILRLKIILKEYFIVQKMNLIKLLKQLWCHLLSIDDFATEKSFVELGGNSVLALTLISHLNLMEVDVPSSLLPLLLSRGTFKDCCSAFPNEIARKKRKRSINEVTNDEINLKVKWRYNLGKCVDASPSIVFVNGVKCIAAGSHSSRLSVITCDNGVEIWTATLGDRIEAGVTQSADEKCLIVGCYDNHVYCLNSENGSILWKFQTKAMVKSTSCFSIDDEHIYVGSYDKNLYCIRKKDGEIVKSIKLSDGSILGRPIMSFTSKLFVGTLDGTYSCLESSSLSTLWMGKLCNPVFSTACLILHESLVIFVEVTGILHCFDTSSGVKVWDFHCGGNIFSSITVVSEEKESICFGCHDKHLYFVEVITDPILLWKSAVDAPIYGTPSFANGTIVCTSTAGTLYLFSLSGRIITYLEIGGEIFSSPALSDNLIFFGCRSNEVVCVSVNSKN